VRELFKLGQQFRTVIDINTSELEDGEALQVPFVFPVWEPGHKYIKNFIVRRDETCLFRVLETHVSDKASLPEKRPDLYRLLSL